MYNKAYQDKYRNKHRRQLREYACSYHAEHREELKVKQRIRWANGLREKQRISKLAKKLNISKKAAEELILKTQGICDICSCRETSHKGRSLSIDHDHKTGKVRGCLCSNCNTGIGLFKDNPKLLAKAVRYLR